MTEVETVAEEFLKFYEKNIPQDAPNTISNQQDLVVEKRDQGVALKPNGLWYGIGNSWAEWLADSQPNWIRDYVHILEIADNILLIDSLEKYHWFNDNYYLGKEQFKNINWPKVAESYAGIQVSPYMEDYRFDMLWYYSLDAASGCIWDPSGLKSSRLVNEGFWDRGQDD